MSEVSDMARTDFGYRGQIATSSAIPTATSSRPSSRQHGIATLLFGEDGMDDI